jgi:hypothetical protein
MEKMGKNDFLPFISMWNLGACWDMRFDPKSGSPLSLLQEG